MQYQILKVLLFICFSLTMWGCGSGDVENAGPISSGTPGAPVAPSYWSPSVPDFSLNPNAPQIELLGPQVVFLALNEDYVEMGATAVDVQGNDISDSIVVENLWNRAATGDYFVRYQVTDGDGNSSRESVRIIRVYDDTPATMMARPVGTTESHLGYIESLPSDYGVESDKQYGLLIFNHGNGSNVEVSSSDPVAALQSIVRGAGPALMQQNGNWDSSLPIITLSPQMGGIGDGNELERFDAFIDYAISTYNIDESRIYITGWSQGGFLSLLYTTEYPSRVAAAVSISGGLPFQADDVPDNICNIDAVPVWLFHGESDNIVAASSSINTVEYYQQNCQPTSLPRLTIFEGQGHSIHTSVYNLGAMQNGSKGLTANPNYDQYDIGLFDWLLQHQNF